MEGERNSKRVAIARLLEENALLTAGNISAALGLEEAEVSEAIAEMEAEGVIVRYTTRINWDKLSDGEKVFANIEVTVTPERDVGFDAIAERILHFPEVHSLYLISGDHDFNVVVEGDSMREIAYFVAERLAVLPGVRSTCTHFVLKSYKKDGDILVGEPTDRRLAISP